MSIYLSIRILSGQFEEEEKNRLLKKYWAIPERQVETSVVLVDEKYKMSKDF
jgi:hypothetical protein